MVTESNTGIPRRSMRAVSGGVSAQLIVDGGVIAEVAIRDGERPEFPGFRCTEAFSGIRPNATVQVLLEDGSWKSFAVMAEALEP